MRYAELTGSSTNPLPLHRPWSGGSNFALKLVNWLSRLLTPLKLAIGELAAAAAAPAVRVRGTASVAENRPDGSLRAPLANARAGPERRGPRAPRQQPGYPPRAGVVHHRGARAAAGGRRLGYRRHHASRRDQRQRRRHGTAGD